MRGDREVSWVSRGDCVSDGCHDGGRVTGTGEVVLKEHGEASLSVALILKISDHFVTLYIASGLLFFIYEIIHPDNLK